MFKLTDSLKAHAHKELGVAATADEATIKAAVGQALSDGRLPGAKFAELTQDKAPNIKTLLADVVSTGIQQGIAAALKERGNALPETTQPQTTTPTTEVPNGVKAVTSGPATPVGGDGVATPTVTNPSGAITPTKAISAGQIKVRSASERYSRNKSVGKHSRTLEPVEFMGKHVELPSEAEYAMIGAWARFKALKSGLGIRPLNDHEKSLIGEMFEHDSFWHLQGEDHLEVSGSQAKAMLDDGTSGGQELVPIWFDDAIITFPLLHSELLPYVEIRDVPRSSRIEGASIGNPTLSWGTTEGTGFSLFNTASLAAAIDTTIFPVVIGLEMGLDFLSDAVPNVGQQLMVNIGQANLKEMDNVIANGNGSNRPTGIFIGGGTSVPSVNGVGGPPTVTDAMNLTFTLGKQYRNPGFRPRLLMNDTTYKRWKDIPVSGVDERRVFGMNMQSYQILDYPVSIQNDIANTSAAMVAFAKYRLYRRRGFDLRMVTEGQTLALKNTVLIVGRGRFGGKITDAAAVAKMTDCQS